MHLRIMKLREITCVALSIVTLTAFVTLMLKSNRQSYKSVAMEIIANPECHCIYKSQSFDFCYRLPQDRKIRGLPMNCSNAKYLEKLGLLNNEYAINLETDEFPEPVFVTAMSDNHFAEGLTLIANFRKFWPLQKLYIYDLGLGSKSVDELKELCQLELRQFPFGDYPQYVGSLYEYRWKPILIAEMLHEFGAVWYMDTSVRWKKDKRDIVYNELKCRKAGKWKLGMNLYDNSTEECRKSGYLLHSPSGHSVFATTDPGMYKYIPTQIEALRNKSKNHDGGFVFAVRTVDTLQITRWYVLCALEKNCMAPPDARLGCSFGADRYTYYANCHRYDQSGVNLLLANENGYNAENYVSTLREDGAYIDRTANTSISKSEFLCDK